MKQPEIRVRVRFFCTASGSEPVREWLKSLDAEDRRVIGTDIKTVQIGWPLGMPLVRKMGRDLYEVRVTLPRRIARILFTVLAGEIVLLHGFIKKSQETPKADLDVARARLKLLK
jgi:phage-related protein